MKPDISEFSYGFALVDELIHWHGMQLSAVPIYPSLYEEGQSGIGYDVFLNTVGFPLFLQFKLSDCLLRRNSRECRMGLLNVPFYRIKLRPTRYSHQHPSLVALETNGNLVFYAAPLFHLPNELNNAFLNRQILDQSVLIKPSSIGQLPDDRAHSVSFENSYLGYLFSEPKKIGNIYSFEKLNEQLMTDFKKEKFVNLSESYLSQLARTMISILIENIREKSKIKEIDFSKLLDSLRPLKLVSYLARTFYDCDFLIITSKK
ncbi:MAG TPA: hypothetical protein PKD67_14015 [Ignavibacteriaceae bacterium]|nr:hypothetical protein [Ignavibacteriaceae bacterium]